MNSLRYPKRTDFGDEDIFVYRLACRRIIALPGGIEAMYGAGWELPKPKAQTPILSALWRAEQHDHLPPLLTAVPPYDANLNYTISAKRRRLQGTA